MKYIVAILVVVTVMHDISLYRLNQKVEILQSFFSTVVHKLEEFVSDQTERKN